MIETFKQTDMKCGVSETVRTSTFCMGELAVVSICLPRLISFYSCMEAITEDQYFCSINFIPYELFMTCENT